jgi:hypothetical protein
MTDAELDAKFLSTAETSLPASKVTPLLAALRGIETLGDAAILARTARVD